MTATILMPQFRTPIRAMSTDPQIPGNLRRYLGEPEGAVLMARE